jgi:SPP1 gp7 family putative phage head morphogenesis protein
MAAAGWDASVAPTEAVAFFRRKAGLKQSFRWAEMWQQEHAKAFTVAGVMQMDVLQAIREVVDAALDEGLTLQEFKRRVRAKLVASGFADYLTGTTVTKPETGEEREVRLGSRRLRTIFDTNLRTSYAAGHWEHFTETTGSRPYLRYVAILDARTRPLHRAWHNTVLPVDHPWWDTHAPPNGWNCRCTLQSLSKRDLNRLGLAVSPSPPIVTRSWTNPSTGEVVEVPVGIDPGFGYNVGKTGSASGAADAYLKRASTAEAAIGARMMDAEARTGAVDHEIERQYAALLERVRARGGKEEQTQAVVLGAIPSDALTALDPLGVKPGSAAVTLRAKELAHLADGKWDHVTQQLTTELLDGLPSVLLEPTAIYFDREDPALLFVRPGPGEDQVTKVIVRLDQKRKTKGGDARARRAPINSLRTASVITKQSLVGDRRYELVWGAL